MATQSQNQHPEISPHEGPVSRVIGALVSPRSTFESIARKPGWLLPIFLILAANVILVFSFSHRIGWRGLLEARLATSSNFAQMTVQQQQQAIERALRVLPILAYLSSTVVPLLLLLAIAAICLGAYNIVFGVRLRFGQSFRIAAHGFMPMVLKGALGILVVWVRPVEGIDLQNLVMSNAGAFLSANAATWLRLLATSIDVFLFWAMALFAIGFAAADPSKKVSIRSSFALMFSLWLVYLVIAVGITAAFS